MISFTQNRFQFEFVFECLSRFVSSPGMVTLLLMEFSTRFVYQLISFTTTTLALTGVMLHALPHLTRFVYISRIWLFLIRRWPIELNISNFVAVLMTMVLRHIYADAIFLNPTKSSTVWSFSTRRSSNGILVNFEWSKSVQILHFNDIVVSEDKNSVIEKIELKFPFETSTKKRSIYQKKNFRECCAIQKSHLLSALRFRLCPRDSVLRKLTQSLRSSLNQEEVDSPKNFVRECCAIQKSHLLFVLCFCSCLRHLIDWENLIQDFARISSKKWSILTVLQKICFDKKELPILHHLFLPILLLPNWNQE